MLLKRYFDLSEGIPAEAVRILALLQTQVANHSVTQLIDVYNRGKELILVIEHEDITLAQVFSQEPYYKLSEKLAKLYLYQMLRAIALIHERRLVHCNLTMSAIRVSQTGILKLCDFELSTLTTLAGDFTPQSDQSENFYSLPPEVLLGFSKVCPSRDIWALGCLFFHMLTGYHPFKEQTRIATLLRVFKTLGTPTLNLLESPTLSSCPYFAESYQLYPVWSTMDLALVVPGTSEAARDLLRRMLEMEPTKRISAVKALSHAFFDDVDKAQVDRFL